ncbi:Serine phosphatase RsbU, regulator of sigma subunit [hydrothermal vent metagenome]|uniref:Serine phosphatase RsbU, regulator of sigma subunit n=1 Tax=hydrothermal vent metagenome TaxID=652676 RepID=A0A3B1E8E9_9ZZZZ
MHTPAPSTQSGPDAHPHGLTLRSFLTDGSLAQMCAELGRITETVIEVRDERDRLVSADADGWRIGEEGEGLAPHAREVTVPLIIGHTQIGSLVAGAGGQPLKHFLALISQTAVEWCHGFLELRHAIDELGVLIELSSLLVGTEDNTQMVEEALDSVLRVLDLDAGSVVMLSEDADGIVSEDERDVRLHAARGLSEAWLQNPESLSQDRTFDRLALAGEVVSIEDLLEDDRVRNDAQVRDERVRGFMCAGLVFRGKPIGVIRVYSREPRVFSELDKRLLRSIAQQAAAAVQQARLIRNSRRDREMERQVRLAADVQRRMLPRCLPDDPRVETAAHYQPSFDLGGDFYDLFEVEGKIAIAAGDVVGKGVPAAMLMSLVRTSFRAHAERGLPPHEVLTRVNHDLCRDSMESEFATMWYGLLDPETGVLDWSTAGHEPPLIVREDGRCEELSIGGLVVGINPNATYTAERDRLAPGESLIVYTDGVTDVMSFEAQRFGKDRLRTLVAHLREQGHADSAHEVLGSILRELRQFGGLTVRPDDTTLVVVRRQSNQVARLSEP